MERAVADWLNLARCPIAIMQQEKMQVPQLWINVIFPPNVQEIVNATSYMLMVLFMEKKKCLDHASGASKKFLSSHPLPH